MKVRNKLTLWVAGAGLLTSLVFSAVVFVEMVEQPFEILDTHLKETAEAVAGRMARFGGHSDAALPDAHFATSENLWIRIYDQDLRPVYQNGLAQAVDLPLALDKERSPYQARVLIRIDDGSGAGKSKGEEVTFRIRVFKREIAGTPYWIQVAESMKKLEEEIYDLVTAIGIGLTASTVLLLAASYMLSARIVKPIADINRLAGEISENTLDKRIPLSGSRDEIDDLSECLNRMFDRIQYSFSRQKRYTADASHELKSPIAILRLFFEGASQRMDLPEDLKRQMDAQGQNVLRMDRLVRSLMDLSLLEAGSSTNTETFDLAELAQSVIEDFTPMAEKAKIRLETEIPEAVPMRGDRGMIRRMLINILDNAIKYNREEGRIHLKLQERDGLILLSLFNTGPGIPEEDIERVFEPFYRVEKSRSSESGGAGLGLAIVREIARLHGGTVSIDSEQGAWTRIDIMLPRRKTRPS